MGPGRLHLGPFIDRDIARYLACDAQVIVVAWQDGKLLGINPTERTPNRRLRRVLEHRDGGCAHPLCVQKRWLHAHHIVHWEDDGLTIAVQPRDALPHATTGHCTKATSRSRATPKPAPSRSSTPAGERIEPPPLGADPLPSPAPDQLTYHQPYGEPLRAIDFAWN